MNKELYRKLCNTTGYLNNNRIEEPINIQKLKPKMSNPCFNENIIIFNQYGRLISGPKNNYIRKLLTEARNKYGIK